MQASSSSCTQVQAACSCPVPAERPWLCLWVNPGAERNQMHFPGCGSGFVQLDACCFLAFSIPT